MQLTHLPTQKIASDYNGKFITYDITYNSNAQKKPVLLFVHGFKGFKDWGHFPLMADYFAKKGFVFIKMNFSHNGTTPNNLQDFTDLDAFGHNNFTIELSDINNLIDTLFTNCPLPQDEVDLEKLYLVGHSRGGATSIIYSTRDSRIKKLVTWAAVCHIFDRYTKDETEAWKKEGVQYIFNGRTNQNMPLYYQLAEDLIKNRKVYDIPEIAKKITIPYLIIHGSDDETVKLDEANTIQALCGAELKIIDDGDHTFGGKHPWEATELPKESKTLCEYTANFLLK